MTACTATKYTAETLHELLDHLQDRYGPVVRLRLSTQVVVVSEPKDIQTVYCNEGKYPIKPGLKLIAEFNKRNNITDDVALLQGEEWRAMRSILNKTFLKVDSASLYLEQQNGVADDFVNILETQKLSPEKFQDLLFRFASESIAVVTFNKRLGLLSENPDKDSLEFMQAVITSSHMIRKSLYGKPPSLKWFRSSTYKTYEVCERLMRRISGMHVAEARRVLEVEIQQGIFNEGEPNLLYSLLSESNLTSDEVSSIVLGLYKGGTETTTRNLLAFLYNLAKNPEKQEKLRREILEVIGRNGPLTAQCLSQMVYLKAVLKESFRLNYPLPIGNMRILPVRVTLGGYDVPAGTPIFLFNKRTCRTHFENPFQFLPERWLRSEENTKKDSAHSMIVLPFGHGVRNCIGQRFARQEIFLAVVKVLQRFKMDLDPDNGDTKFIYKLFIEPERPILFRLTRIR
ncbi:hypothetical protein Btru_073214 [Bulinus truncatus]|nr:hypothetical protein Btru_073214 [Bulinus truncatus]